MSRIRSIHPGLFTDEAFASLSHSARLLVIGLWVEAWDDGVFEWKPLTLKMRIFPADNLDVAPLLAEIEAQGIIRQFTAGAKSFGVIRNFCKFQRPKKPNSSGVLPDDLQSFVSFERSNSEPVPNQFRTGTENRALMEDGGCSKKDIPPSAGAGSAAAAPADPPTPKPKAPSADPKDTLWREGPIELVAMGVPKRQSRSLIGKWLRDAIDPLTVLGAIVRAREERVIDPVPWVTQSLQSTIQTKKGPANGRQSRTGGLMEHLDKRIEQFRSMEETERNRGIGDNPQAAFLLPGR